MNPILVDACPPSLLLAPSRVCLRFAFRLRRPCRLCVVTGMGVEQRPKGLTSRELNGKPW